MKKLVLLIVLGLVFQITTSQVTDTGDKVGIGNTNPDMKLSVNTVEPMISRFHHSGNIDMSGIRIGRNLSYSDLVILPSGFGIGTGTGRATYLLIHKTMII